MATELTKVAPTGKADGTLSVDDAVFGLTPNEHVMYLALRRELVNARHSIAQAKTRAEVRGGGKKPWKQKGTGKARAGSIRSPLWVGGGVIFGPRTRSFSLNIPKKVRALAIRSSLSAARDKFRVVESFAFLSAPKTKEMASFLKKLELTHQKILILANDKAEENKHLRLAARNIPGLKLRLPENLSVHDLLNVDAVIATQAAVEAIDARYRG